MICPKCSGESVLNLPASGISQFSCVDCGHVSHKAEARKCTIGGMHGNNYCEGSRAGVLKYLDSLSKITDCDHFMLTNEMPEWLRQRCRELNVEVIDRPRIGDDFHCPEFVIDCHRARLDFMNRPEVRRYHTIIHTDARDIFFQEDIPLMASPASPLHLVSEGIPYRADNWNLRDMDNFMTQHGNIPQLTVNSPIINGGQQIGTHRALLDFYERVLCLMEEPGRNYTDQAITNYLVYSGDVQATVHEPNESDLCLTGRAVAMEWAKALQIDGHYVTDDGRRFKIVHQEDRMLVALGENLD